MVADLVGLFSLISWGLVCGFIYTFGMFRDFHVREFDKDRNLQCIKSFIWSQTPQYRARYISPTFICRSCWKLCWEIFLWRFEVHKYPKSDSGKLVNLCGGDELSPTLSLFGFQTPTLGRHHFRVYYLLANVDIIILKHRRCGVKNIHCGGQA